MEDDETFARHTAAPRGGCGEPGRGFPDPGQLTVNLLSTEPQYASMSSAASAPDADTTLLTSDSGISSRRNMMINRAV